MFKNGRIYPFGVQSYKNNLKRPSFSHLIFISEGKKVNI